MLHNLIGETTQAILAKMYDLCKKAIAEENWSKDIWHWRLTYSVAAAAECYGIPGVILLENPGMEWYDIRKKCPGFFTHDCYNFTYVIWRRTEIV